MTQNMGEFDQTITVKKAWGERVEGEALVIREGFSPRYDLDRWTGLISRVGHSAEGQSIKDKVLVFPSAKGGVAGGWAFFDLVEKGIAPKAFVFGILNPVMVQGAVLARIPIMEGWENDVINLLRSGDKLIVDPATKTIRRITQS